MDEEVTRVKREVEQMRLNSERQKARFKINEQILQAVISVFVGQINAPLHAFISELRVDMDRTKR